MGLSDRLRDIDRFQQSRPRLAFVAAVYKKFQDDQAGSLAALIAYYGFVSLFPLLLLFVTILGFVIHGNPTEQHKVLDGTLGQIPLLKDQLTIKPLGQSGLALAVAIVLTLLGGFGVTGAAQNAFNQIWHVPFKNRPNFLKARLRGLGLLVSLGALMIISTGVAGFVTAHGHGPATDIGGIVLAFALNLVLFLSAFKLLTSVDVSARDLMPGVVAAAVGWQILQHLGGLWARKAAHLSTLYGTFGIVLGLLAVLYLGAQVTIFAAEINVVRLRRLWPRSLLTPPLTDADRRALTSSAEVEERVEQEDVHVTFDEHGSGRT